MTVSTTVQSSWDAVLDEFAVRLADQRAALDAGEPDRVPPFVPPASIGPMPVVLRGRAEGLLRAALELEAEMAESLAANARESHATRRFALATSAPAPSASFFDNSL